MLARLGLSQGGGAVVLADILPAVIASVGLCRIRGCLCPMRRFDGPFAVNLQLFGAFGVVCGVLHVVCWAVVVQGTDVVVSVANTACVLTVCM